MSKTRKKILWVGRSTDHFTYYQSAIEALLAEGHEVTVLYDEKWSQGKRNEALHDALRRFPALKFDWLVRRSDRHREWLFKMREVRSLSSYIDRWREGSQTEFYLMRWNQYVPREWRLERYKTWQLRLLASPLARMAMYRLEQLTPPDPKIADHIRGMAPDAVVTAPVNLRFSEEVDYLKAAKRLRVPSVSLVLSWDNLTTKGLFHVRPDRLLCWSSTQMQEAVSIHGINPASVSVVGSPFFDKWFGSNELASAGDFLPMTGLDPARPYLLYLGSSANIARDETWQISALAGALKAHSDPAIRKLQLLVRPHPANTDIYRTFRAEDVVVWPLGGALPDTAESRFGLYNSVRHAAAVIGINTSGMLDAIILGAPIFSLISERYLNTQRDAVHFRHLIEADAIYTAFRIPALLDQIAALLKGPDPRRSNREGFVRDFVRPQGLEISAGARAASEIELIAGVEQTALSARTSVAIDGRHGAKSYS